MKMDMGGDGLGAIGTVPGKGYFWGPLGTRDVPDALR